MTAKVCNAYARHLWREKHRRAYTFTKTRLLASFIISLSSSVFLDSYYERLGDTLIDRGKDVLALLREEGMLEAASAAAAMPEKIVEPAAGSRLSYQDLRVALDAEYRRTAEEARSTAIAKRRAYSASLSL